MAASDYVPVAADDWYQRRRQDAEGEFFRAVADQGPRKGEGGSTRQGIYCLTAAGRLLAYKNAGQAPEVMREVLRDGLTAWRALPEADRRPGAVVVPGETGQVDDRFSRRPPAGGLVLDVFTRALDRNDDGKSYSDADCSLGGGDEAARDHLWLTRDEWRSLVPAKPVVGQLAPVPAAIVRRIARFHLVDDTRGEPPFWSRDELRTADLTATVEAATPGEIRLRLDGRARLATDADPARADRGYDARLLGYLTHDRKADALTRFDLVAVGDHWGEGPHTRGARPGRTPLGVAFAIVEGDGPADAIPPQAAREANEYFRP